MPLTRFSCTAAGLALCLLAPLAAQAAPRQGTVVRFQLHATALENNSAGDTADPFVSVYLPPSYATSPARRYPVVYLLHGYTNTDLSWYAPGQGALHVPSIADRVFAADPAHEMIIVTPNAMTIYGGSNYSSGTTAGDWETFIAVELVRQIDRRYRTLATRESRGLAGHSMGGYGTMRIGMKHPDVFSSIYALSPCCMGPESNIPKTPEAIAALDGVKVPPRDFREIPAEIRTAVAAAASWAPNPRAAPLFFDMPFRNGVRQEAVIDRMKANRPLVLVDQYVSSLRRQNVAFDVGDQDPVIAATVQELAGILSGYKVPHRYEVYAGTHTSHIPQRIETRTLPFFASTLRFGPRR